MAKKLTKENLEANYEKYKSFGNDVYKEYENLFKQMWSKLNASNLEPFAKVLFENENIILKGQEDLVDTIRHSLEHQMQQALQNFWQSNNVSEALISLEMCKEKFKDYEGHKWNMDAKTPLERTRPIRMRFKENRSRYLQTQLNFQTKQLEKILQENAVLRQRIRSVTHQRTHLIESMKRFREQFKEAKVKIIDLQQKMLVDNNDKIGSAINAEIKSVQQ